MFVQYKRFAVAALAAGSLLAAAPASADVAAKLGSFKNWAAYTSGIGDAKVCYALSEPRMTEPVKVKRDKAYILINDWPVRKAKSEPEIVPGYQYKDKSTVTVEVGSDKFEFFTQNDGATGGAWVKEPTDETRLIEAMRRGAEIIVTGISKRGTMTRDTYSLAGLSDALDKVHQECGL
jgi:hypothetical protein